MYHSDDDDYVSEDEEDKVPNDETGELGADDDVDTEKPDSNDAIAEDETRMVLSFKLLIFIVVSVSAVGIALSVYHFVSMNENSQFEAKFKAEAAIVIYSIGNTVEKTIAALDGFAVAAVSSAHETNQTWPFVTISNFALRASKLLTPSEAFLLWIMPVVSPDKRKQWGAYSVQHSDWALDALSVQDTWNNYFGPPREAFSNWEAQSSIFNRDRDLPQDKSRPYIPVWQAFPIVPTVKVSKQSLQRRDHDSAILYAHTLHIFQSPPFNFDKLPDAVNACLDSHRPVLGDILMVPA
jgi:hypothetical protein